MKAPRHKFLFLCALLPFFLNGQTLEPQKYSRVKIFLQKEAMPDFMALGFEFDHAHFEHDGLVTTMSESDILLLKDAPYAYEVLIEDETVHFLERNANADFYEDDNKENQRLNFDSPCSKLTSTISTPAAFTPGSMGGYLTLAEMNQKIDDMIAAYPTLISTKENIGNSIEGRPIYAVKISDNPNVDEEEAEVHYNALHHAREPNSMHQLIFFMQYLLENYATDDRIKELVDSRELYFVPCLNPDGYEYNYQTNPNGGGFFRKNRRPNSDGTIGVDLNRNYSHGWGYNDSGSSPNGGSNAYRGTSPFSELETMHIRNYTNSHQFKLALHYHSYGNYWINPLSVPNTPPLSALEEKIYDNYGAIQTRHNCYKVGTDVETVGYNANGVSLDWAHVGDLGLRDKIFAFTPEAGIDGFWPTQNRIIPIAKENLYANLQLAYLAGNYTEIEDWSSAAILTPSGQLPFKVTRLGLTEGPVVVTLMAGDKVATVGAPIIIPASALAEPFDTYLGQIDYTLSPNIQAEDLVTFTWKVENGGTSYVEEITKIYQPVMLLEDDMEGSFSNWTKPNSSDWAISNEYALSGQHALTDSPNGNGTIYSQKGIYLTSSLDLANAQAAYLSFWVRHESKQCIDRLQVEASINGTGPNALDYTPLCGNLAVTESYNSLTNEPAMTGSRLEWTKEQISLEDYLGQCNVGIRFLLYSGNSPSIDGFYIDDIQIIKKTTPVVLPLHLLAFEGSLLANGQVSLDWRTEDEVALSHFVVEHSKDALNFQVIGQVEATGEGGGEQRYNFVDNAPFRDVTYYRLRSLNLDGSEQYSPIISIQTSQVLDILSVFPTPTNTSTNLVLKSNKESTLHLRLFNLLGQKVLTNTLPLRKGHNFINLNLTELESGVYLLHLGNELLWRTVRVVKK